MPQRFLRPGLRNSERWNSVSWPAQSLFVRLLTLVDDYGRYDGRPSVIWGECFAVWNQLNPDSGVSIETATDLISELQREEMLECYTLNGKPVIQVTQWQERIRPGSRPKWGSNPSTPNDLLQVAASCSDLLPPTPSSPPSSPPSPSPSPTPTILAPVAVATGVEVGGSEKTISPHAQFIRLWCNAFLDVWKYKYEVKGSDAKHLKTFLADHSDVDGLIATAHLAWDSYRRNGKFTNGHVKRAVTIMGFCANYREMKSALAVERAEVSKPREGLAVMPEIPTLNDQIYGKH